MPNTSLSFITIFSCIFLLLSDRNEDDDDGGVTEVRFVPSDKGVLQQMFEALKECQTLHPDPNDSFSEGIFY